jgi:hypothetical protein
MVVGDAFEGLRLSCIEVRRYYPDKMGSTIIPGVFPYEKLEGKYFRRCHVLLKAEISTK